MTADADFNAWFALMKVPPGPLFPAHLAQIKAKVDPGNLFRVNQNIKPAINP